MQEIVFEHVGEGKWERSDPDPEDDDLETVTILDPSQVHSQIESLKERGWKLNTDVDEHFDGFILVKPKKDKTYVDTKVGHELQQNLKARVTHLENRLKKLDKTVYILSQLVLGTNLNTDTKEEFERFLQQRIQERER